MTQETIDNHTTPQQMATVARILVGHGLESVYDLRGIVRATHCFVEFEGGALHTGVIFGIRYVVARNGDYTATRA